MRRARAAGGRGGADRVSALALRGRLTAQEVLRRLRRRNGRRRRGISSAAGRSLSRGAR